MKIRRLKASGGAFSSKRGSQIPPEQIKESRVNQEYNYLRNSQLGSSEIGRLKDENARLAE